MVHFLIRSDEPEVTIDRKFVREQAEEAVRQFFRPLTAPFQIASGAFLDRESAIKAAKAAVKTTGRQKR
jgi:hypothetical protein